MRRADRLYALVEELRARAPRPVSRALLAGRLEVTERTVERDVLALQQAGVPIWSQRGRGGGYAIDPRRSLPPLNLDATEALAVMTALAAARTLPFATAGRRAEQKLLAAMGAGEAARARELAGRLRLSSFGLPVAPDVAAAVERAVVDRRVVELGYRDRHGRVTRRPVEAQGLHVSGTGSYLIGWCRLRDAGRAFRLDRIVSVYSTGQTAPEREIDALLDWVDGALAPEVSTDGGNVTVRSQNGLARRRPGPPRRADDRTGSGPGYARALAASLPAAVRTARRGRERFSVEGGTFLTLEGDHAVFTDAAGDRASLLLPQVGRQEVRDLIEGAWASFAPKRAVTTHRRAEQRRAALPAITQDDIRRMILALPGATEGPIWGSSIGFLIGTDKKTRFAKFGPPVGNLLPPDDEDTLVIFRCQQRPELLASRPDRYFITPHYGEPDEPGSVITRLCEHRGPDDLRELGELLEDSWREVAPSELVARRDEARTVTTRRAR